MFMMSSLRYNNISSGQKIYDLSWRDRFLPSSGNTDIWHQTGQTTPDYNTTRLKQTDRLTVLCSVSIL